MLPGGQPLPQIVATVGTVQLQLPVAQTAVTAIGYHQAGDGSLALDPVGRQGNAGLFARIWHRLAGAKENRLVWYQLRGDRGPGTSALAVGAAPGTDVYAPVDGTVVGITDFVLANRTYGARIDIRPHAAPSVVVSLTHLRADPALTVGSAVTKARSKMGVVVDLTAVERQALARYTQDAGNNVSLSVRPAARALGSLKILFVGDVVGAPGRRAVEERLRRLREELGASFCVVNGENLADGVGITPKLAARILAAGADVITLGNHTWRRSEINSYLQTSERVIRPANFSKFAPGRGLTVAAAEDGTKVAVINVMGSLFLSPAVAMFEVIDELVEEARAQTPVILVDVHAEATSEKVALSRWLDGRVTAVVGTAHARADLRRARSARRHGGDHRRRHDRAARLGDRSQGRPGDLPDADRPAGPLRDRRGRCPDRRSARRVRRVGARYGDRAGSRSLSLSRTTSSATSTRSRASTSSEGSTSSSRARSQ